LIECLYQYNNLVNILVYFGDLVILWLLYNSCHQPARRKNYFGRREHENTKYHKNNLLQINNKTLTNYYQYIFCI